MKIALGSAQSGLSYGVANRAGKVGFTEALKICDVALANNNDHKITHRSTIMVTRPCGDHIVTNVFVFEVPSSSEWSFSQLFVPNYFVSLTDAQLALKWNALECYKGEM